jgi:general stress protein 26
MILYFLCCADSQKAQNLAHDDRISLTIDHDTSDLTAITGLSMAARAEPLTEAAEVERILRLLLAKYPEASSLELPTPSFDQICVFRVTPTVVSVLDYSKGFGHADLVTC